MLALIGLTRLLTCLFMCLVNPLCCIAPSNVPYLIILFCLMPDDFTHQEESTWLALNGLILEVIITISITFMWPL